VFNSMGGGYFPGESTGVARRPEGGAWVPANEGLPSLDVNALALDPVAPSVLYAATAAGVASTRNGAGHWERAGLDLAATVIAVDGTEPRTVYAGTAGRGLFRAEVIECTGAGDCDDGDPCSADVCDPSNGLADVNGCVRDRTGFTAIACLVRGTSDDLPCADLLPARAKRRIAQDLTRASRLIEKAGSRARSRRLGRATALVRGAKRLVLRVADREGGPGTPGQQCFQFLDDVLESFVGQVRALRSR
jgi:hypothetical protein